MPDLRRTLPLYAHMRGVGSTPLTTPTHSLHTEHEEGPAKAPRLWAGEGGLLLWSWSCLTPEASFCPSEWPSLCPLLLWVASLFFGPLEAISLSLALWVAISLSFATLGGHLSTLGWFDPCCHVLEMTLDTSPLGHVW